MQEFRKQLNALGKTNKKHYLLTMFGPTGQQNFSNIQLAQVAQQLDYYNIQGYDFHGDWESQTNHDSPPFDDKQDSAFGENFYIDYTIESYLRGSVPPQKLVLGHPDVWLWVDWPAKCEQWAIPKCDGISEPRLSRHCRCCSIPDNQQLHGLHAPF